MKDMKENMMSDDMLEKVTGGAAMTDESQGLPQNTVIKMCEVCGGNMPFLTLSGGREKCTGCGEIKSI